MSLENMKTQPHSKQGVGGSPLCVVANELDCSIVGGGENLRCVVANELDYSIIVSRKRVSVA